MKQILLLSAYRSDSHAAWSDWLTANLTDFDWQLRQLPGRHFAWRIRGNPLSWLDDIPQAPPDLILATSMVDLATLKGLHPQLANVAAWYYFHENQFVYPASDRQVQSVEARMVQIYGALAADRLLFNSAHNRDTFLAGVDALLEQMPDGIPETVTRRLAPRCDILPVPVESVPAADERDPRLIVWNHRWEYDKAPEVFAEAMLQLAGLGAEFRLALLGPRPRIPPEPLKRLRDALPDRIIADGKLPGDEYRALLGRAGIAVSTAVHEFQGIGMLEAASAGARPLVPDALCYREQYADPYRYRPGDPDALVERLRTWLDNALPPPAAIGTWLSPVTAPMWQQMLTGNQPPASTAASRST